MRYLLLALVTVGLLSSCNKDQTLEVPATRAQMLVGSNKTNATAEMPTRWKTTSYKVHFPDSIVTTLYAECAKDDYLQFFEDYSGKHNLGDNKCAQNDGDVYNFRWEFSKNDTYINFYDCDRYFGYRTFIVEVTECSDAKLSIKFNKEFYVNSVLDTLEVDQTLEKF